jgi:ubiquinone/menaquinone biosynthesis C-methylase UbiE
MRSLRNASVAAWRRLISLGFRLLYNELAWTYDLVSWAVSKGLWRTWQKSVLAYLPCRGRVLELGAGPGHLQGDLASAGHQPVGLDLSRSMLRLARRRKQRSGSPAWLCQGHVGALPFAPGSFDAIVATFPTNYIYDPAALRELGRLLEPGGRLAVVELASLSGADPLSHSLEWLYQITGQRGPAPDLVELLTGPKVSARRVIVELEGSTVSLVLADRLN